jgi:hypothetical protein
MSSIIKAPCITVQQYLGFRSPRGYRDELINGEIVVSPERKPLHHDLAENVFELLKSLAGSAFKVGMRINMTMEALNSAPSPDVWVVDREKWRAARAGEYVSRERAHSCGRSCFSLQPKAPRSRKSGSISRGGRR